MYTVVWIGVKGGILHSRSHLHKGTFYTEVAGLVNIPKIMCIVHVSFTPLRRKIMYA